ncbi:MAG: phosphatase PAP2 family protein [Verrucomicrobiota bacterium]
MPSLCQSTGACAHRPCCTAAKYLVALLLIGLCLASFLADDAVAAFFARQHSYSLNHWAAFLNCIGDWPFHTTLGLTAAAAAWWAKRKSLMRLFLTMLLASSMAGVAVNAVRFTTGRPRPNVLVHDGFYGFKKDGKQIVWKNQYKSFPSAHTATAAAFAGVALFAGIRYGWLIALFGPLIGCARIYSGAHHFSDVVTATMLGLLFSCWAWRFVERRWGSEVDAADSAPS